MSLVHILGVAGHVALLLWGTHMVTSGLLRALGARLQPWLERHLATRFSSFLAGLGLTTLLQSSTATGLMSASLAARGVMTLSTGLAIMLGANVGTALVAQVLSFDVSAFAPILVLAGFLAFRAHTPAIRQWGRAGIGLGLMIVALHNLLETLLPLEKSVFFSSLLHTLNDVPWVLGLMALALTWVCHSSVAVILLTASLAHTGLVSPAGLLAMVLGANMGGAIPPLMETRSVTGRRIPLGNALTRLGGVVLCAPFIPLIATHLTADPRLAVDFHLGFNVLLTLLAMPLGPAMGRLVCRLLPLPLKEDPGEPLYLAPDLVMTPASALGAATREVLRTVEMTDVLFRAIDPATAHVERDLRRDIDLAVDKLGLSIRRFLSSLDSDSLPPFQRLQSETLVGFTLQMGHLTDVLLAQLDHADDIRRAGVVMSAEEQEDFGLLLAETCQSWQMMVALVISPDRDSAMVLHLRKSRFRALEEAAELRYATRASHDDVSERAARHGGMYLQMLRNLRRLHSHMVGCAYPILNHIEAEQGMVSMDTEVDTRAA
jgi:phosphate:Na+ symporter